jgi:outer membrane protein assembly factor BamB
MGNIDRRRFIAATAAGGAAVMAWHQSLLAQTPDAETATPEASPAASPVTDGSPASSVPMFRGDAARSGVIPGPLPSLDEPIVLKWQFSLEEGSMPGQPVLAGGVLFVSGDHAGSEGGNTYAIDAGSGQEVWRFTSGPTDHNWVSPEVFDDTVFVMSDQLHALDAKTGLERWRFMADTTPNGATPTVAQGTVYVHGSGMLQALDAVTGEEKWRFSSVDVITSTGSSAANAMVFVGDYAGNLYAVDATTGLERWRFPATQAIWGSPSVVDGIVYFTSDDGNLYALDAEVGTEVWRYSTGYYIWRFITVSDGRVFFVSDDYGLYAVDARDGRLQWRFNLDEEQWRTSESEAIGCSPVVVDGVVVIVTGRTILAIDAESGSLVGELTNHALEGFSRFPIAVDGTVYVGWNDSVCAVGNLPALIIIADTVLRGAPSSSGVERAQLEAGTQVRSTGNREDQGGFSWIEVSTGEVTGWIPMDAIDPATMPPDDIVILYEP